MVLTVRDTLVCQRTLLINTLRGHATEFGVISAKGTSAVGGLLKANGTVAGGWYRCDEKNHDLFRSASWRP